MSENVKDMPTLTMTDALKVYVTRLPLKPTAARSKALFKSGGAVNWPAMMPVSVNEAVAKKPIQVVTTTKWTCLKRSRESTPQAPQPKAPAMADRTGSSKVDLSFKWSSVGFRISATPTMVVMMENTSKRPNFSLRRMQPRRVAKIGAVQRRIWAVPIHGEDKQNLQ